MQDQKRIKTPKTTTEDGAATKAIQIPDISHIDAEIESAMAGTITIRIGQMPGGRIQTIAMKDLDKSIKAAAEAASLTIGNFEIQVRGLTPERAMENPDLDTQLVDGDMVLLVEKITGNIARQEKSDKINEIGVLRQSLEHAQEIIHQQDEALQKMISPPLALGTVLEVTDHSVAEPAPGDTMRLKAGGFGKFISFESKTKVIIRNSLTGSLETHTLSEFEHPDNSLIVITNNRQYVVNKPNHVIRPGMRILLNEHKQVVGVTTSQTEGDIHHVRQILEGSRAEVDIDGTPRIVRIGTTAKEGDRVILDDSKSIAVFNLGKSDQQYSFAEKTNVSWEDIGGLSEAKQLMKRAIELPFQQVARYKFYNKKPPKGLLLSGPPGNGKTLLGKAASTAIASIHGRDASLGFFYVKGPEMLNKWVGESERMIRQLFISAKDHKDKEGYPAVILIDEADAILSKRGSGRSSDMEKTIVPMFLAEMDGMEDSGALVILATNRPDQLDPAITRDGRVDLKVRVPNPTPTDAADIFQIYLRKVPLQSTLKEMTKQAVKFLFSPDLVLYKIDTVSGVLNITLGDISSGAMIANLVDLATSVAIDREIAFDLKSIGITIHDLEEAVKQVFEQNKGLNHQDILNGVLENLTDQVINIQRIQ